MSKAFLTIRLETSIKKEVERIAKEERRSTSQVGLILLELGLKLRKESNDDQGTSGIRQAKAS